MFAKVTLELAQRDDAILIPEEAVFPAGDEQFVYLIDDGKATRARVRTGVRRDGKVQILEGVRGGDLVVTAGQQKLARDGSEVRIVVPPPAQGG
jgi:membrane fusion protein (multidrug efflux system)